MRVSRCLRAVIVLAGAMAAGCTFNHVVSDTRAVLSDLQLIEQHRLSSGRDWVAPRTSSWLVAVSRDGPDRATDQALSRQLAAALRQSFATVAVADAPTTPADAVRLARHNQADFMVYPQLIVSGDGAYSVSEWAEASKSTPGKPFGRDRAAIKLLVFDVHSGQLLDTVALQAKESWLPGVSGDLDGLFDSAFTRFAESYSYQQAELPR